MKRTKNMFYNPTEESRELELVTLNDGRLWDRVIDPIINNMEKKAKKGIYNTDKAIEAFYHATTEASNQYYKDFGYRFTVTERWTASVEVVKYIESEYLSEYLNDKTAKERITDNADNAREKTA